MEGLCGVAQNTVNETLKEEVYKSEVKTSSPTIM
jgi:hypothetical protein